MKYAATRETIRRLTARACSLALASILVVCGPAFAATVTLKDGTVIQGEVKSLQDGIYTIETASVGTLHISQEQIRSIDDSPKAPSPSDAGSILGGALSGTNPLDVAKSLIAQDPKLLTTVLELQSDPDMVAVLNDPEIMKAIAAGNYTSLMSNPKIAALMQNPKVRALVESIQ